MYAIFILLLYITRISFLVRFKIRVISRVCTKYSPKIWKIRDDHFFIPTLFISLASYKFNSRIIFRVLVLVVISRDGLFLFPAYVCKQKFLDILLFAQPLMKTKPISDINSLISLNWSNHFFQTPTHFAYGTEIKNNFQHPYPSEEQKKQLSQQTGLTILQVNNWWVFMKYSIRKLKKGWKRGKRGIGVW